MTIELYTAATPNGWKVAIMLEELKAAGADLADLEVHPMNLSAGEQFSEAFTAINPNQKIPALVDRGQAIMESCAILQYLGERYPTELLPAGPKRWQVLPWLYWQAANLGPVFGNKLSYTRYLSDVPEVERAHPLERFGKEAARLVAVLDAQLAKHDYVSGDSYTVADIAIWPWVRAWKWAKVDITARANVVDWVHRVRARPAVELGIAYGVPDSEKDQFSADRKASYQRGGASIASNDRLKTDI